MTTFSVRLRELCDQAKTNVELICRKTALDIYAELILRSPVDTGRFRSNWTLSPGAPLDLTSATITDERALIAKAESSLPAQVAGQVIYIANSLPYARRLEYGWSKQAPAGMVGLTVQRWDEFIRKAAAEVRR